jgi:hypothetical protein
MAATYMRRRARILPAQLVLKKGEDRKAFDRLRLETLREWKPDLGEQSHLVERLILALWNLRRAAKAEAKVMSDDELDTQKLSVLGRYRRATQREVDQVSKQLRILKGASNGKDR